MLRSYGRCVRHSPAAIAESQATPSALHRVEHNTLQGLLEVIWPTRTIRSRIGGQPGETLWDIYIIDPGMKQRIVIPVNILIGQTTVRPYRLG